MNTTQIEITPEYLASQGLSTDFPERFWMNVIKETSNGCWLWNVIGPWGYGRIRSGIRTGARIGAHVASWILHFGPVPKGLCILHRCDVRICVRPDHLWLGTRTDNARDRDAKHRLRYGQDNPMAKLTNEQVQHIRKSKHLVGLTQQEIADMFGVNQSQISRILNHNRWRYLIRP